MTVEEVVELWCMLFTDDGGFWCMVVGLIGVVNGKCWCMVDDGRWYLLNIRVMKY